MPLGAHLANGLLARIALEVLGDAVLGGVTASVALQGPPTIRHRMLVPSSPLPVFTALFVWAQCKHGRLLQTALHSMLPLLSEDQLRCGFLCSHTPERLLWHCKDTAAGAGASQGEEESHVGLSPLLRGSVERGGGLAQVSSGVADGLAGILGQVLGVLLQVDVCRGATHMQSQTQPARIVEAQQTLAGCLHTVI